MKKLLLIAAALGLVPTISNAAVVVYGNDVAVRLSVSVTSAFLPRYSTEINKESDSYCYVQYGPETGCEGQRTSDSFSSLNGLNLESHSWASFTVPETAGWVSAGTGHYADLNAELYWYNETGTEQTASWRVDFQVDENHIVPDSGYYSTSLSTRGESDTLPLAGCSNFSIQGSASGFFNCSQRVAAGGAFDLYARTSTVAQLYQVLEADLTPVPLPATLPMLFAGIAGFGFWRRKKA